MKVERSRRTKFPSFFLLSFHSKTRGNESFIYSLNYSIPRFETNFSIVTILAFNFVDNGICAKKWITGYFQFDLTSINWLLWIFLSPNFWIRYFVQSGIVFSFFFLKGEGNEGDLNYRSKGSRFDQVFFPWRLFNDLSLVESDPVRRSTDIYIFTYRKWRIVQLFSNRFVRFKTGFLNPFLTLTALLE